MTFNILADSRTRFLVLLVSITAFVVGCKTTPDMEVERTALLDLHERVLAAHRANDVDAWMNVESEEYVSANNGTISFPTLAERRSMRAPYLGSTTFSEYRDRRPPIVQISHDATLGWVIAEVEVQGTRLSNGTAETIDAIWAWIELYEKRGGEWRLIGNVSNQRPPSNE